MNFLRTSLCSLFAIAAAAAACSSTSTSTSNTNDASAGPTTDSSMIADAKPAIDSATEEVDSATSLVDAGRVECQNATDCGGSKLCCVHVNLGPGSYPNCSNVSGETSCVANVSACSYVGPSACGAQIVSHACDSNNDCGEEGAPVCCDVSAAFSVPTGSRVCVDTQSAVLLKRFSSSACL